VAASIPKLRLTVGAVALLCAPLGLIAGVLPKPSQAPIDMTASSFETDRKNNTISVRKVHIVQGNMTLTADQGQVNGSSVENSFDNSVWVFKGSVKVTMEGGALNSDDAQVTFLNKVLSKAVVTGRPATFQQKIPKSDKTATGHADNIDYDVNKGLVRLTKDAYLNNGQVEAHGESLKYDIVRQVSTADAGEQDSQRVHFVITPPPPKSPPPASAPPAQVPPNP
jgi:lipopolysaccharide export system protein LptA